MINTNNIRVLFCAILSYCKLKIYNITINRIVVLFNILLVAVLAVLAVYDLLRALRLSLYLILLFYLSLAIILVIPTR